MTLAELQTALARLVGLVNINDDPKFTAWAPSALNEAQVGIAGAVNIPRYTVPVVATDTILLPANIQTGGLLNVVNNTDNKTLPIVDLTRAYDEFGGTAATGVPLKVGYDGVAAARLFPAAAAPVNLSITYAAVPATMVNPTDEPWDGLYADFHRVIAYKAALLLWEGDWPNPERVEFVKKRYYDEIGALVGRVALGDDARNRVVMQ